MSIRVHCPLCLCLLPCALCQDTLLHVLCFFSRSSDLILPFACIRRVTLPADGTHAHLLTPLSTPPLVPLSPTSYPTAARLFFKWALKLNPKCATCLKNWGEALTVTNDGSPPSPKFAAAAEEKIRRALELLPHDSDALFSLGVLLSGQGRKEEAMEAYSKSLSINADDHELCYNLAVQYGAKGEYDKEIEFYNMALAIKADFGSAWANLGVAYASTGRLKESEGPFLNACKYQPEKRLNWLNLARFYQANGNEAGAKEATLKAEALH